MSTTPIEIAACAFLAWAAAAPILAPSDAFADSQVTDRHEIPNFVLKRTELATDAEAFPTPTSAAR
jgi:hypothetical protein